MSSLALEVTRSTAYNHHHDHHHQARHVQPPLLPVDYSAGYFGPKRGFNWKPPAHLNVISITRDDVLHYVMDLIQSTLNPLDFSLAIKLKKREDEKGYWTISMLSLGPRNIYQAELSIFATETHGIWYVDWQRQCDDGFADLQLYKHVKQVLSPPKPFEYAYVESSSHLASPVLSPIDISGVLPIPPPPPPELSLDNSSELSLDNSSDLSLDKSIESSTKDIISTITILLDQVEDSVTALVEILNILRVHVNVLPASIISLILQRTSQHLLDFEKFEHKNFNQQTLVLGCIALRIAIICRGCNYGLDNAVADADADKVDLITIEKYKQRRGLIIDYTFISLLSITCDVELCKLYRSLEQAWRYNYC